MQIQHQSRFAKSRNVLSFVLGLSLWHLSVCLLRCGMVCGCTVFCSPQVRCSARHTRHPPPWQQTSRRDAPSRCSPSSPASSALSWLCWGEAWPTAVGHHLTHLSLRPPPGSARGYLSSDSNWSELSHWEKSHIIVLDYEKHWLDFKV